jgi:hypothetical protein
MERLLYCLIARHPDVPAALSLKRFMDNPAVGTHLVRQPWVSHTIVAELDKAPPILFDSPLATATDGE